MTKKIRSDGRNLLGVVDVYEAIKRALIRRGIFPDNNPAAAKPKPKKPGTAKMQEATKLQDFTLAADEILYSASSVFPFQLFPDTITIDREKVTIALRSFYKVAKIISVHVNDMLSIEADIGPFFGTVLLTSRFFSNNPQKITWLSRDDAIKVQRILQGHIIAHQKKIDMSEIKKNELCELLERLGQGVSD